jgi:hypothetical protein
MSFIINSNLILIISVLKINKYNIISSKSTVYNILIILDVTSDPSYQRPCPQLFVFTRKVLVRCNGHLQCNT